jgi:phage tail-like protein
MAVVRDDPYTGLFFEVTIEGVAEGGGPVTGAFSEVQGLEVEVQAIEYRTGAEEGRVRKLPGLRRHANLVLRRGVTGDLALWSWFKSVLDGQVRRSTVRITLLDESRQAVLRWTASRAWPCRWSGPTLDARSGQVAIETLEIAHEGLELE